MAKNKKKKKSQPPFQRKTMLNKHSKTYFDTCYATARRIFKALGEDESTFDMFTKRQKHEIFGVVVTPPRIAAMHGHKVPRTYIRYIQDELITFLNHRYFNKEAEVTWMDMTTTGMAMVMIFGIDTFVKTLPSPQREIAERMNTIFDAHGIFEQVFDFVENQVKTSLLLLSQPNFRIYGQCTDKDDDEPSANMTGFRHTIRITTHECQSLRFKYHNKERTAFRIATGGFSSTPYTGATIAMSKIFPGIEHDRQLNIYIQSHAILRFKERINTLYPIMRNELFVVSLMFIQRIVRGPNGVLYIACIMPSDAGNKIVAYFGFTIDGDNLLVLTLLPLLSYSVPEGRVLYERLHLSTEDLKYLGMDKLSFFYDVDIEQIPALKQVLFDELHLDYIRTIYNSFRPEGAPFNEKKTLLVKNFFQKLEEHPFDSINEQNVNNEELDF
ncbi:MAG: hypothetical protein LBS55_12405 [Prevotellaceae bacterium]|jgi:hypothetical protein|nr:hypothetical protein [Prevotellaceae bacterium]